MNTILALVFWVGVAAYFAGKKSGKSWQYVAASIPLSFLVYVGAYAVVGFMAG